MKPEINVVYAVSVTFDSSEKRYMYKVSKIFYDILKLGDRIYIKNDRGYDYRGGVVTVQDFHRVTDCSPDMREIVDFRQDYWNHWYSELGNGVQYDSAFGTLSMSSMQKIAEAAYEATVNVEEMSNVLAEMNVLKENNSINKMFGNIEFGKYTGSFLRPSWKGMAYRSGDAYVCWDKDANDLVDVTNFTIPNTDFIYLIPVAISDVKVGDVIKHNGEFVIATAVAGLTGIKVIAPQSREVKTILPMKNVFGFDFVTKVVSFIDLNLLGTPNSDNPFGNMGMLLALSGDKIDTNTIMMMSMMQGGKMDMSNPMMMYFMLKDGNNDMLLPLMLMQNGGLADIWPGRDNCRHTCNDCDCDCDKVQAD